MRAVCSSRAINGILPQPPRVWGITAGAAAPSYSVARYGARGASRGEAAMTPKSLAAAVLLSLLGAAASGAQEATPETPAADAEDQATAQPETRRPLRVLENPYDISSFYRSSDGLV